MVESIAVIFGHRRLSCDQVALVFDSHFAGKFHFHLYTQDCEVKLVTISLRFDHNNNISFDFDVVGSITWRNRLISKDVRVLKCSEMGFRVK